MELAHAGSIRLAFHHLLASLGPLDSQQNTVRRIPWWPPPPLELAAAHDRALGANDAGGTGEIPPIHGRTLRLIRIANDGSEVAKSWAVADSLPIAGTTPVTAPRSRYPRVPCETRQGRIRDSDTGSRPSGGTL